MKKTNISYLKQNLSACLQEVREGTEYLVLDRKTPVAVLSPLGPLKDGDELVTQLCAEGLLRPASRKADPASLPPPLKVGGPPASSYIIEERGER